LKAPVHNDRLLYRVESSRGLRHLRLIAIVECTAPHMMRVVVAATSGVIVPFKAEDKSFFGANAKLSLRIERRLAPDRFGNAADALKPGNPGRRGLTAPPSDPSAFQGLRE